MKTVFSGIQPTGKVHLGNLLGAINNWVHLSNEENKNYFCVVDLHSLTTHPDPSLMQENINETIKVIELLFHKLNKQPELFSGELIEKNQDYTSAIKI